VCGQDLSGSGLLQVVGFYECGNESLGFTKDRFWLAERLLASQEGLCCVVLLAFAPIRRLSDVQTKLRQTHRNLFSRQSRSTSSILARRLPKLRWPSYCDFPYSPVGKCCDSSLTYKIPRTRPSTLFPVHTLSSHLAIHNIFSWKSIFK
jgi:hypothetical protein